MKIGNTLLTDWPSESLAQILQFYMHAMKHMNDKDYEIWMLANFPSSDMAAVMLEALQEQLPMERRIQTDMILDGVILDQFINNKKGK